MIVIRALLAAAFSIAGALHFTGPAQAQAWPTKQPVKIVVPFPAGGPTDGMARVVSERLGTVLNQLERYGEEFDPNAGSGDLEVWIPIKR